MASFPSSQERTVATSLLLLRSTPPSPSFSTPKTGSDSKCSVPERSRSSQSFRESSVSSLSDKSSASSLTNDDGVSSQVEEKEIKSRNVSFLSATVRYRQMKFKIARKIRSKVMWTSSCSAHRKPNAGPAAKVSPGSLSGDASSSLSSSPSGISSARSLRYANRLRSASARVAAMRREPPPPPPPQPQRANHAIFGSPHLRRRGESILKLLSLGGSSEVRIRQLLGDSPDTSKALRM